VAVKDTACVDGPTWALSVTEGAEKPGFIVPVIAIVTRERVGNGANSQVIIPLAKVQVLLDER
jgi:hypothetical protein